MEDGKVILGSLYIYAPNKGAPIFFTIAYAASAVGHIWQCYHYKCFKLVGLHPICAVLFTAGYALREYGAFNYLYNTSNLLVYILSQVFINICPPLLELANYRVLGRVLLYVPYLAPLPPGRVLSLFGGLIALVETLNALGVSLSANPSGSQASQQLGSHLTLAALAIQLGVIVTFVIVAAVFHQRCVKAHIRTKKVSVSLTALYMSMDLILIRCIYRLVEHTGNTTVHLKDPEPLLALTPILRHEWFFYIFDATLMLVNSVIWNVWNPGRYLPQDYNVYLADDGRTELIREGKPDQRSSIAKIASTLTFGLLFRPNKGDGSFTELNEYPVADGRT